MTVEDMSEVIISKLEKQCNAYFEEIEKHKKAVEKLINKVMADNYTEELDEEGSLMSKEDWKEWAYEED